MRAATSWTAVLPQGYRHQHIHFRPMECSLKFSILNTLQFHRYEAKDCFSKAHIQRLTARCHSKHYHKTNETEQNYKEQVKSTRRCFSDAVGISEDNKHRLDAAPNSKHICKTEWLQLCIPTSHCAEGYEYKTKQLKKRGNVLYKHSRRSWSTSLLQPQDEKNTCPSPNMPTVPCYWLLITPIEQSR